MTQNKDGISFLHMIIGVMIFTPMSANLIAMPIIIGNLENKEFSHFMTFFFYPIGFVIIPFCVYFALFTKPNNPFKKKYFWGSKTIKGQNNGT